MKTMQLREAKAKFSALVQAAEDGESTIVTKNGRPAAMLVPIEEGRSPHPKKRKKRNFAQLLMSIPHPIPWERDRTPSRDVEF
jgi:antitoxin Phd